MTVNQLRKALETVPGHLHVKIGCDGITRSSGPTKEAKIIKEGKERYFVIPDNAFPRGGFYS